MAGGVVIGLAVGFTSRLVGMPAKMVGPVTGAVVAPLVGWRYRMRTRQRPAPTPNADAPAADDDGEAAPRGR